MLIGIDVGFSGGVAVLDQGKLVEGFRMPITSIQKRDMIDGRQLTRLLVQYDVHRVVIEQVHSMPRQGVASTFKFGRAAGAVEAWAVDRYGKHQVSFITPQRWKRHLGLTSDKRQALAMAADLWEAPTGVDWGVLRNDGIAEAALLAKAFMELEACQVG